MESGENPCFQVHFAVGDALWYQSMQLPKFREQLSKSFNIVLTPRGLRDSASLKALEELQKMLLVYPDPSCVMYEGSLVSEDLEGISKQKGTYSDPDPHSVLAGRWNVYFLNGEIAWTTAVDANASELVLQWKNLRRIS